MSLRVDLSLVRFSPIEDTYYFYDAQHPTAIQFLLNGQWESWDVGWVKHHAHDPEIKHIAAGAEAHAIRQLSTYEQWRSTPMPRVASARVPFSPSVGSDISRPRDPLDRPFYPQDVDFPLSPQFSPASSRDVFSPTATNAPLPPVSQPRPRFSPAPISPSAYRPLPPVVGKPSLASEDSLRDRPPSNSPPASHSGAAPAPRPASSSNTYLPALASGSQPISYQPPISSLAPSSNARTTVSIPPPLSIPSSPLFAPSPALSVPTPAPQPVVYTPQAHNARHTDSQPNQYPPMGESDPNVDPRLSTIEASINFGPHATPTPPSRTTSPLDDYGVTYREPDLAPSMQSPQAPSLLPRKSRDFKIILSLDGDGIRGLSQVFLVEALVGAICTKLDQNIDPYQIFDLVGGTSMGGVLGLMLSRLRMQAHTAREAYKLVAKEVFQDKKAYFYSLDPHTVPVLYDGQGVEEAIKTVVAGELPHVNERLYDAREDSADAFAVTTQVKIGSNKAALMRSYRTRRIAGPEVGDAMLVWQAMKAAVLAPRYVGPQNGGTSRSVIEPGLVDYGTTKDNPISDTYYECRNLYKYSNDKMVIVSVGTGFRLNADRDSGEMSKNVLKRQDDAEIQCLEFERDQEGLMKSGWLKYFRFNVPNLDDAPLEEWCNEEQFRDRTTAYLASPDTGLSFHKCVDDITAILTGTLRQL